MLLKLMSLMHKQKTFALLYEREFCLRPRIINIWFEHFLWLHWNREEKRKDLIWVAWSDDASKLLSRLHLLTIWYHKLYGTLTHSQLKSFIKPSLMSHKFVAFFVNEKQAKNDNFVFIWIPKRQQAHITTAASSTEQTKFFYANDGEASGEKTNRMIPKKSSNFYWITLILYGDRSIHSS